MRNRKKKSSGRRLILPHENTESIRSVKIWWDVSKKLFRAGRGDAAEPIRSLQLLQQRCAQASSVAVTGLPGQCVARWAVGEVCPLEKIRVVYGTSPHLLSWADVESPKPYFAQRQYLREYDYPLSRLQMAARSPEFDLISCFRDTLQGAFHEFWGMPLTSQAAELWANVGDLFDWKLRDKTDPIDFSRNIRSRSTTALHGSQKALSRAEAFFLTIVMEVMSKEGPAPGCGIRLLARAILDRCPLRPLILQAWSGTPDWDGELRRRTAETAPGSMHDPRQWIWRALLRAPVKEVNLAYLEACVAWVLGQIQHPELFPPETPLFDAPARRYFAERGFPSRAVEDSPPLEGA